MSSDASTDDHGPQGRSNGALTRFDVMTAREVGELLRLPASTVYDLARRGLLPGHRVGRAWRFIRHEIEDALRGV
jgi:excisionase family DNA binding protein